MRLFSSAEQTDLEPGAAAELDARFRESAMRAAAELGAHGGEGGEREAGEASVRCIDVGAHLLDAVGAPLAAFVPPTPPAGNASPGCALPADSPGLRAAGALLESVWAEEVSEALSDWLHAYEEIAGCPPALGEGTAELLARAASAARLPDGGRGVRAALSSALDTLLASHEEPTADGAAVEGARVLALLCMPAAPSVAPAADGALERGECGEEYVARGAALSALASLAGCPQLVVPTGTARLAGGASLPLAVSFVARRGRDEQLVCAAARAARARARVELGGAARA